MIVVLQQSQTCKQLVARHSLGEQYLLYSLHSHVQSTCQTFIGISLTSFTTSPSLYIFHTSHFGPRDLLSSLLTYNFNKQYKHDVSSNARL